MGRTEFYDLTTIDSSGNERLTSNGYKYTNADRQLIDRLLKRALTHDHSGTAGSLEIPTLPPELTLSTTGGNLQGGLRIYYKYTLVDENGFESAGSPEVFVDTATQLNAPGTPILSNTTTGGTNGPGTYWYVLTAWNSASTQETRGLNPTFIEVPITTSTNEIRITFPSLPPNADGFNIYRKEPGASQYYFLVSLDLDVATPATYYDDDGSVTENCARTLPNANTTMNSNSVAIQYPGATPTVPAGYTWKIYRTFTLNNYTKSLLTHMTTESSPGVIEIDYTDTGLATLEGSPPSSAQEYDSPGPINFEDGADIVGRLPLGNITAFPFIVTFVFQGTLEVTTGEIPWTCPFPSAQIVKANARLGVGSTPASASVIVDIRKYDANAATPTTASIWSSNPLKPTITVGNSYDVSSTPTTPELLDGDYLLCDIVQAGGGATPTDENLVVQVLLLAQFDAATSDFSPTGWE